MGRPPDDTTAGEAGVDGAGLVPDEQAIDTSDTVLETTHAWTVKFR